MLTYDEIIHMALSIIPETQVLLTNHKDFAAWTWSVFCKTFNTANFHCIEQSITIIYSH